MQLRCSRRVQFGPLSLSASLCVKAPRRLLDAATSKPRGRDWKLNVHFERRASHDLSQGILGCTHRHYAESRKTAMEELSMVRWLRLSALPALSCTKRNVAVPSANWDYSKLLVRRLKLASQLALALAQAGSYPTIILNRARTAARGRLLHWDNTGRHWQPLSRTPALAALAVFACTLPTRWKVEARA
jgi:hypothetical protein